MRNYFKVLIFTILTISSTIRINAQIYDSTLVYDTVTDADDFYLFSAPKPCFDPQGGNLTVPGTVLLQEYVPSDTVPVYGVAITFENHSSFPPFSENNTSVQACLMSSLGHSAPPYDYYYSMQTVDTVTLNRAHPRFCWFLYEDACNTKQPVARPCYEFYFDTPGQFNQMTDTFYVGYEWDPHVPLFHPDPYGGLYGIYDSTLPGHLYMGLGSAGASDFGVGDASQMFAHLEGNYNKVWGIAFPIIGFRCKPVRQYSLDSYTGATATVSWSGGEDGGLYDVRLVGEDGSDTTYVTSGTALTLQNLSDSVRYNVMVRKRCHYATSNYDTTVCSDWLSYLSFGTTILDTVWRTVTAVSGNPGMGVVEGGGVYMDSSTVTLTANSYGGYAFGSWNDGIADNPRQIFVVSDTAFTALFREDSGAVGIRQHIIEDFVLEPNPAHGCVQVLLPAVVLGGQMVLCDMTGRELMVFNIRHLKFNVDVSTLPAGTYLLRISTPTGVTTKKLLIKQ